MKFSQFVIILVCCGVVSIATASMLGDRANTQPILSSSPAVDIEMLDSLDNLEVVEEGVGSIEIIEVGQQSKEFQVAANSSSRGKIILDFTVNADGTPRTHIPDGEIAREMHREMQALGYKRIPIK